MSITRMSPDPRLAQRAAEDGLDWGDFSWLHRSSTPLSKMTVVSSLTTCHVRQSLWKGASDVFSAPVIDSNILLAPYGLRMEEEWRFNVLQATGCSFHLLFQFCSSIKLQEDWRVDWSSQARCTSVGWRALKFQARYPQFHTYTPNVNPAALLNSCFHPTQKHKQRESGFRLSPWRSNPKEMLLENPCQSETLTWVTFLLEWLSLIVWVSSFFSFYPTMFFYYDLTSLLIVILPSRRVTPLPVCRIATTLLSQKIDPVT